MDKTVYMIISSYYGHLSTHSDHKRAEELAEMYRLKHGKSGETFKIVEFKKTQIDHKNDTRVNSGGSTMTDSPGRQEIRRLHDVCREKNLEIQRLEDEIATLREILRVFKKCSPTESGEVRN